MKEETQKHLDGLDEMLAEMHNSTAITVDRISDSEWPLPDDLNKLVLVSIFAQLSTVNQLLGEICTRSYQISDQLASIEFNTRGGTYPKEPPEFTH